MSRGVIVRIPVAMIDELKGATPTQLATVEVDELGSGLRWDELDVDLAIPGVMLTVLGVK
jgi:hypothetical protein